MQSRTEEEKLNDLLTELHEMTLYVITYKRKTEQDKVFSEDKDQLSQKFDQLLQKGKWIKGEEVGRQWGANERSVKELIAKNEQNNNLEFSDFIEINEVNLIKPNPQGLIRGKEEFLLTYSSLDSSDARNALFEMRRLAQYYMTLEEKMKFENNYFKHASKAVVSSFQIIQQWLLALKEKDSYKKNSQLLDQDLQFQLKGIFDAQKGSMNAVLELEKKISQQNKKLELQLSVQEESNNLLAPPQNNRRRQDEEEEKEESHYNLSVGHTSQATSIQKKEASAKDKSNAQKHAQKLAHQLIKKTAGRKEEVLATFNGYSTKRLIQGSRYFMLDSAQSVDLYDKTGKKMLSFQVEGNNKILASLEFNQQYLIVSSALTRILVYSLKTFKLMKLMPSQKKIYSMIAIDQDTVLLGEYQGFYEFFKVSEFKMISSGDIKSKKKDNCINNMLLLQNGVDVIMVTDAGVLVSSIQPGPALAFSNEVYLQDHSATSVLEYEENKLCVPISHESLDYVCLIDRATKSTKMIKHGKKTWTSQLVKIEGYNKAILVRDLGGFTIVDFDKEIVVPLEDCPLNINFYNFEKMACFFDYREKTFRVFTVRHVKKENQPEDSDLLKYEFTY